MRVSSVGNGAKDSFNRSSASVFIAPIYSCNEPFTSRLVCQIFCDCLGALLAPRWLGWSSVEYQTICSHVPRFSIYLCFLMYLHAIRLIVALIGRKSWWHWFPSGQFLKIKWPKVDFFPRINYNPISGHGTFYQVCWHLPLEALSFKIRNSTIGLPILRSKPNKLRRMVRETLTLFIADDLQLDTCFIWQKGQLAKWPRHRTKRQSFQLMLFRVHY